ncbi:MULTISPECIES: TIM barrel protein [unclassified Fusibacter]|uniref:TIM barrel protein n=1 Tax=unclassified Fusibacter TaxID=2624464 RepID=UPI001011B6AE|nr:MULTISPECIES: TIM barrel protein [unclassified Fusibacter]MCK8060289.1 TIM barrel protein [Fusibacter sp. A2]NPE20422.1 TIM barrel protein [Fusibacter sp. A1]RXV63627.1 hypothetical protein DWB64_01230 [Fusibacter sp. A1]
MKKTYRIGMHGGFDHDKFSRDYMPEFIQGIEVCSFETMDEVNTLFEHKEKHGFSVGVHFPMFKGNYKQRDPLYLHKEKKEREDAFYAIEQELILGKRMGIEYLLMHFPKPMPLDVKLPWNLAVVQDKERYTESELSKKEFEELCIDCIKRLNELSTHYDLPIVLELDLLNGYLNDGVFLSGLLKENSAVKVCLDSARMHVNAKIDPNFDMQKLVGRLAPYTKVLHLSNVMVSEHGLHNRHHPVSKDERTSDGYGDTHSFLQTFNASKQPKELNILFEHQSTRITIVELISCYDWVIQTLKG